MAAVKSTPEVYRMGHEKTADRQAEAIALFGRFTCRVIES